MVFLFFGGPTRAGGGEAMGQLLPGGRGRGAHSQSLRLTSSADTRISLAFSSASCLMNRTICSIWRWTCCFGISGVWFFCRARHPAAAAAAARAGGGAKGSGVPGERICGLVVWRAAACATAWRASREAWSLRLLGSASSGGARARGKGARARIPPNPPPWGFAQNAPPPHSWCAQLLRCVGRQAAAVAVVGNDAARGRGATGSSAGGCEKEREERGGGGGALEGIDAGGWMDGCCSWGCCSWGSGGG